MYQFSPWFSIQLTPFSLILDPFDPSFSQNLRCDWVQFVCRMPNRATKHLVKYIVIFILGWNMANEKWDSTAYIHLLCTVNTDSLRQKWQFLNWLIQSYLFQFILNWFFNDFRFGIDFASISVQVQKQFVIDYESIDFRITSKWQVIYKQIKFKHFYWHSALH